MPLLRVPVKHDHDSLPFIDTTSFVLKVNIIPFDPEKPSPVAPVFMDANGAKCLATALGHTLVTCWCTLNM